MKKTLCAADFQFIASLTEPLIFTAFRLVRALKKGDFTTKEFNLDVGACPCTHSPALATPSSSSDSSIDSSKKCQFLARGTLTLKHFFSAQGQTGLCWRSVGVLRGHDLHGVDEVQVGRLALLVVGGCHVLHLIYHALLVGGALPRE